MRLRVLGTAAGGGVPQWNCGCTGCRAARACRDLRRTHASLALDTGQGWLVVNATPDITRHIERTPELRPAGRTTPVTGVVLTDAELDHTLGLPRLREATGLQIIGTPAVLDAVRDGLGYDAILSPYTGLTWRPASKLTVGELELELIPVSAKRPRYAADRDQPGPWVSALRVTAGATTLLYAPCLATWPEALDGLRADAVFLDGTFWSDDEPLEFSDRTATGMGHLPITATLDTLAGSRARVRCYTHLNNTNPLVLPDAPEHKALADAGVAVAVEGALIEL